MSAPGLIIAAAASGSGKTTATLGLLRALRRRGLRTASAKVGPDYIDPRFHETAGGGRCVNIDPWAMRPALRAALATEAAADADIVIIEGVMGLFDGAAGGGGATADLAAETGWPVVLLLDVAGVSGTAAAIAAGLRDHRADIAVVGVIANRVAGARHAGMIETALQAIDIPFLGAIPRNATLQAPSRRLGLVQARERPDLAAFIDAAADAVAAHVDLDAVMAAARVSPLTGPPSPPPRPLGQRIAYASDDAFAFVYPHLLAQWRAQGAALLPFSPLNDDPPDAAADAVYMPGGYPELHAGALAAADRFKAGVRAAAARGAAVVGECGGYMVLGETLIDGDGARHAMLGLLPQTTSMAAPKLTLGYRAATALVDTPWGPAGTAWRGHEFHHAVEAEANDDPVFACVDAMGRKRPGEGRRNGSVFGGFLHFVDPAATDAE